MEEKETLKRVAPFIDCTEDTATKKQKKNPDDPLLHNTEDCQNVSLVNTIPLHLRSDIRKCPYLGTINRHVLDFDFEKLCSISLSNLRPYGCLVCGKYFQGRGKGTNAMIHSLECQHYIFINLHDTKVYCLPENYEVIDASLNDIKYHLNPTFTKEEVYELATVPKYGKALDGTDYIPGCIGLNNLKRTDYFNVIIQMLSNVIPLRNYFLLKNPSDKISSDPVIQRFGELMHKIYNPNNFKGIVSPHEFLQAVGVASQKRFKIGQQQDPLAFLSWLLQRFKKLKKDGTQDLLIRSCFEAEFLISTSYLIPETTDETTAEDAVVPALFLTLKVPPAPIFTDPFECNTIPQLPIFDLLQKFDGTTCLEPTPGKLLRYNIWKLPPYLIVHINRFSKNNFFLEKNPTVVTFPVKNFDLKDYVHPLARDANPVTRYDLVANIIHQGKPNDGQYKCHIFHQSGKTWYEIEDLRVVSTLPQMVALSESYVQLYQRQDLKQDGSVDTKFTVDESMVGF